MVVKPDVSVLRPKGVLTAPYSELPQRRQWKVSFLFVAFSRSCDSPNFWLAEAKFVLGSCNSVWPRAVVQRGGGAPSELCVVQNSSLRVLALIAWFQPVRPTYAR